MPIIPAAPYPKGPGDSIRSADWNQTVDEVIRLDNDKLNLTGGAISGDLTVSGNLGLGPTPADHRLSIDAGTLDIQSANALAINTGGANERLSITAAGQVGVGTTAPNTQLRVDVGGLTVGPFAAIAIPGHIEVTGPNAEFSFTRRSLAAWPNAPAAGDRYVWYNQNGTAALFTDGNGDLLTVDAAGNLSLKKTTGGFATLSHSTFSNEGGFKPNLKVIMGSAGIIFGGGGLQYEFMVGHTFTLFQLGGGITTSFQRSFSIDEAGVLRCSGAKGGYVVDNFINAAGDTLEQGDVVVISRNPVERFTGVNGKIPLPEVDLTDQAYDTRLCGIVDSVLVDSSLPYVEPQIDTKEQARFEKAYTKWAKNKQKTKTSTLSVGPSEPDLSLEAFLQDDGTFKVASEETARHPLAGMAAPAATLDRSRVADHQMGDMVTLGAYSFCKVDADIAPIEPGDLLTTSPTKGHAQKVLDHTKASGAILGKALGSLKKGKGKIPVLVSFH